MDISRMLLIIKFLINTSISQNKLTRLIFDFSNGPEVNNLITLKKNTAEENYNLTTIKIQIFTGSSFDSAEIKSFPIYEPENIYRNVDAAKPSVMFLHSYNESPFNITIRAVIGAYLERGTDNVLLLDWTDLASRPYWPLLPKLKDISRFIVKTLDRLFELGLNVDTFHLVGFSLGAEIAGFIGISSKYLLPRFT
ncbi:GSCOCG00008952001-RA-CDS, partial [Cotesia congregata]